MFVGVFPRIKYFLLSFKKVQHVLLTQAAVLLISLTSLTMSNWLQLVILH